jgi:hypothetical protein
MHVCTIISNNYTVSIALLLLLLNCRKWLNKTEDSTPVDSVAAWPTPNDIGPVILKQQETKLVLEILKNDVSLR